METNRHLGADQLEELALDFENTVKRVNKLFGKMTFSHNRQGRSKFNAAAYDAQMLAVSKLSQARYKVLAAVPDEVQSAYAALEKDPGYVKSITLATSDKSALQGRVHRVSKMLKSI